jgi:hypothetical protein
MRIRLAAAALLAPLAAGAITLTLNGVHQDLKVGSANCKTLQLIARWDLQTTPTGADRVRLLGTVSGSSGCTSSNATSSPDQTFVDQTPPTQQVGTATVSASTMTLLRPDGGVSPCDDPSLTSRSSANPLSNTVCAQYIVSTIVTGGTVTSDSVGVKYAFAPPTPPASVNLTPGDSHLKVSWTAGDSSEDLGAYAIHVMPEGDPLDGGAAATSTALSTDVTHTDDGKALVNDQPYSVQVVANDNYGNVSPGSAVVVGVPVATEDFFNHYRQLGGGAKGCQSADPSLLLLVAALAIGYLLRRKPAALVVAGCLLATAARAEDPNARRFLLGFKLDKYDPKVDTEPGLTGTPYHDVFGGRVPLRFQVEFDWQVAHPMGALMAGVTAGFWQNIGKAILSNSAPGSPQKSQDSTMLNLFPFGLIATWRFDWLADQYRWFPFIPYAQAGLMRTLWVSYNGIGKVSTDKSSGDKGQGWTSGYTFALGVAFSLNVIDPELASEGARDAGIQRTSAFAEYGWTYLDNYGKSDVMVLSDRAWRFGISVEF